MKPKISFPCSKEPKEYVQLRDSVTRRICGEYLLTPRPTLKLEDYLLSLVKDRLQLPSISGCRGRAML